MMYCINGLVEIVSVIVDIMNAMVWYSNNKVNMSALVGGIVNVMDKIIKTKRS